MRTSSAIYTCKIAFDSSKMGYKIIIFPLDLSFLYIDKEPRVSSLRWYAVYKNLFSGFKVISSLTTQSWQKFGKKHDAILLFISCSTYHSLSIVHTYATRHDTTACDTTRFFSPHTIKWISSHICSTTMSGRHDKKLRQQKSLWKRFLSCVAATVSRKLLQKTVSIVILP